MTLSRVELAGARAAQYPPGIAVASEGVQFWMSGATAIPLYHMHPHVEEECVLPDDIREQTRRVLVTFDEVLRFNGLGWRNVVRFATFLTDLRDHDTVHAVIAEFFSGSDWSPASTVVGINALSAPGARIEIEVVAAIGSDGASAGGPAESRVASAAPGSGRNGPSVLVSGAEMVFLSGVGPDSPVPSEGGIPSRIETQAALACDGLERVLSERALSWPNVVKVLIQLTDLRDSDAVRESLAERFGRDWRPAITVIQVDNLPAAGARVQFDVIAASDAGARSSS